MPEKRVLVVEDERIVALDIKNRLESLDYEVCGIVHTGEDAVAQSGELSPTSAHGFMLKAWRTE